MDLEQTPSFLLFGKALLPGHCHNGFFCPHSFKGSAFQMSFNGDVAGILQFMGVCVPNMALFALAHCGSLALFYFGLWSNLFACLQLVDFPTLGAPVRPLSC